jgi:uncharacterized membrane protein YqiK
MRTLDEEQGIKISTILWLVGIVIIFILSMIVWFGMIHAVKPDAGHEAVLIHKPIIFGHGGVDPEPVRTGRSYVWFTTDYVYISKQPMQFDVKFDDLMSSDGVPLDFHSIIRLKITDSVKLIRDFGPNWYENNVDAEFRNRVRQAVRKHGMNETAIDTKAIDAIDAEVSAAMKECIKNAQLPLIMMDVTVGKANPPDSKKTSE